MVVVVGEGGLFGKISSVKAWRFLRSPPIEGTNIFLSFLQNLDILDQVLGVLDYIGTLFKNHRHVPPSLPFRCLNGDIV